MCKQCVPGFLSPPPREPGNEANNLDTSDIVSIPSQEGKFAGQQANQLASYGDQD